MTFDIRSSSSSEVEGTLQEVLEANATKLAAQFVHRLNSQQRPTLIVVYERSEGIYVQLLAGPFPNQDAAFKHLTSMEAIRDQAIKELQAHGSLPQDESESEN